ncbi:hypothetical protein JMT66_23675 (plasmid) [Kosakonia cowanii]|uniref:hypothetical protein n=1 Tax=Kosakonia cowanii TaxID=208223 RepID=UPI001E602FEF|nr:hypothetical protein [Kosakonia cowanii]UGS48548.1 hypothetical protein JMT66_23675 [Kosakonia cowanii]
MSISDEDKKGYSAIGEAVISHIFSEEEITRDSLIHMLGRLAEKEADEEHLVSLWQARGILQSVQPPAPFRPDNVVSIGIARQPEGHDRPGANQEDNSAQGQENDPDKASDG